MAENLSARMVDILMLESGRADADWTVFISALLLLLLIIYFAIRIYRQPLRCLQRQLVSKQLTARQAAHQLTALVELSPQQSSQLQTLRFAEAEPETQQLLDFIQQIRAE